MEACVPISISVRTMLDPPGGRTVRHKHFYVQAGYVVRGCLDIEFDRHQAWRVNPGEFFSIAAGQPHVIRNPPDQPVESLDLRFKTRPFEGLECGADEPESRDMERWVTATFRVRGAAARALAPMLRDLLRLETAPCDVRAVLLGVRLLRLAREVVRLPQQVLPQRAASGAEHRAVVVALDLLRSRYREPLSGADLARAAGISAGHLIRLFRRDVGTTPKQYLLQHRIECAKRLMTGDAQSLKAIALETGFRDFQQFSRAFRRLQGCSPSMFPR